MNSGNLGKVFYIGNFDFPKGNAAGIRVLNNGYLLRELGYDVEFIGLSSSANSSFHIFDDVIKTYENFRYFSFEYPRSIKEWFFISDKLNSVKILLTKQKPAFVILYGSLSNSIFTYFLVKWCRANDVTVYSDCVDWLHISSDSIFFKIFKTIDTYLQKRIFNTHCDGVITVSSHLSDFYNKLGLNTVVIPPLNSPESTGDSSPYKIKQSSAPLSLFYAGYPFDLNVKKVNPEYFKDRLDLVLDYLSDLSHFEFVFNIYGMTKDGYLKVIPRHDAVIKKLGEKVNFHGKVSNDVVGEALRSADYIILLRHSNRMTNFGFPSKISEAMGRAVPAITTRTSDLDRYIRDGENGYFVDIHKPSDALQKLKYIFENHADRYPAISRSCVDENPFYYSKYSDILKSFLTKC